MQEQNREECILSASPAGLAPVCPGPSAGRGISLRAVRAGGVVMIEAAPTASFASLILWISFVG